MLLLFFLYMARVICSIFQLTSWLCVTAAGISILNAVDYVVVISIELFPLRAVRLKMLDFKGFQIHYPIFVLLLREEDNTMVASAQEVR